MRASWPVSPGAALFSACIATLRSGDERRPCGSRPAPAPAARSWPGPAPPWSSARSARRRGPAVRRRGAGRQRGQARPALRGPGRLLPGHAAGRDRPHPRRRLRGERPEMSPSRQPGPAAAGDRQLPGLPVPAAGADSAKVVCTLGNFATKLLRDDVTPIMRNRTVGADELRQIGLRSRLPASPPRRCAIYAGAMLATLRADFAHFLDLLAKPAPEQPAPEPEPEPVIEAPETGARARRTAHRRALGLFEAGRGPSWAASP